MSLMGERRALAKAGEEYSGGPCSMKRGTMSTL
jgi:hypothetical protein